jgi:hypothetical protein
LDGQIKKRRLFVSFGLHRFSDRFARFHVQNDFCRDFRIGLNCP